MIGKDLMLRYLKHGLCVLPADRQKKRPTVKWSEFQDRCPNEAEVAEWCRHAPDAITVVCGKVSGNLEVIDFDNKGELFCTWVESLEQKLFDKLVIERSPSGGFHAAYRCESTVGGNAKLAQRKSDGALVTLIETRGEGGVIMCAPTENYVLKQGDYIALPVLSSEEREMLLASARQLNEYFEPHVEPRTDSESHYILRPGDDYNERGDVRSLLTAHGWQVCGGNDGSEYFRRPGKSTGGHSASLRDRVFYVFSPNAPVFKAETAYSPFAVYALLEHNGDFNKAARELLQKGFGHEEVPANDPLPKNTELEYLGAREIMNKYPNMKEPVIGGILRRGEVMNLVAAPKTGKSWLVMQLALALTYGRDWIGYPCAKSHVLMIDNELHRETLANRLTKVATAMGISIDDAGLDSLIISPQRGNSKDIQMLGEKLAEFTERKFDVIMIDALYKALPPDVDENSNGQITGVYNTIDAYAQKVGAAIILVHHTSKGNQSNKSVTDIGSGAGAQSRSPDTHMTLREHKEPGIVSVFSCVRSFPPPEPFCLRRDENNLWILASEYSPEDLDGRREKEVSPLGKMRQMDVAEVAETIILNIDDFTLPMPKTLLTERVREVCGTSKDKATGAIQYLQSSGYLEVSKGDPKNRKQAMRSYDFGPASPFYKPAQSSGISAR